MKIRSSAWHFRLYRFLISMWSEGPDILKGRRTTHKPRDLCHYFWTLVLMMISTPIWSVLAIIALIIFGVVVIAVAFWEFVLAPPFRKMGRKFDEHVAANPPKPTIPKEPGLLKTYMRARKSKLCPVITVVDE